MQHPPTGLAAGILTVASIVRTVAASLIGALGLALGWSLATTDGLIA